MDFKTQLQIVFSPILELELNLFESFPNKKFKSIKQFLFILSNLN